MFRKKSTRSRSFSAGAISQLKRPEKKWRRRRGRQSLPKRKPGRPKRKNESPSKKCFLALISGEFGWPAPDQTVLFAIISAETMAKRKPGSLSWLSGESAAENPPPPPQSRQAGPAPPSDAELLEAYSRAGTAGVGRVGAAGGRVPGRVGGR